MKTSENFSFFPARGLNCNKSKDWGMSFVLVNNTRMLYDDIEKRKGFEKAMQELERRFGITCQEM